MTAVTIGVFPPDQLSRHRRLLDGLGELYCLRFEPREEQNWNGCAGALLFDVSEEQAVRIGDSGVRCLAFIKGKCIEVQPRSAGIHMAQVPSLAQCFRGRTLPDETVDRISVLTLRPQFQVMARKGDYILWVRTVTAGGSQSDLVASECPSLSNGDLLFRYFQRDNWVKMFPLMHFLAELSAWKRPALRACFMFDDPNLHWKSYGYLKFEQLAQHAKEHNYHVSLATVPLDTWYVHKPTAAFFRENREHLSTVVHGNNHIACELAQSYSDQNRLGLGIQAIQRIRRFEERSGLDVARVMVAPHGALTEENARVLVRAGFEAACVSRQSLMKFNQEKNWHSTIGLNVAEFVGDGFPVISRFGLSRHREVDFYLAAFLGKPIILDGHHDDVSHGLNVLRDLADLVNSFGNVRWMNMTAIARSNFSTACDGDLLQIRMYSRRVELEIPPNVRRLAIHRAWQSGHQEESLQWREGNSTFKKIDPQCDSLVVSPGARIEIHAVGAGSLTQSTVSLPRTPLRAVARRWYCEARDRLKPTLNRFGNSAAKTR